MIHKVVVASDSFKGSLSSLQVAAAVREGIHAVCPGCEVIALPMADGGEGTVEALHDICGGSMAGLYVRDPLGRMVKARYLVTGQGSEAIMEMASASGLCLLGHDERNPLRASSYGTGQMIADALSRGCRRIIVGLGGSATNDGGMGMLQALGVRFTDKSGNELPGNGESMAKVEDIDLSHVVPALRETEFVIACDVDSPFCGPHGAAHVFSPQKGADTEMIGELDRGMAHFAEVISRCLGKDVRDVPGAGAAGGLGGAFLAFTDARLERGIEMILDTIGFDMIMEGTDMVITGEGRVDQQTLKGKTAFGIMKRAERHGVRTVLIGGSVILDDDDDVSGFDSIWAVTPPGMPLYEAMKPETASANVTGTVAAVMKAYMDVAAKESGE